MLHGYLKLNNTNAEEKITICQRVGGFVGHVMAGSVTFENCTTENMTATAFQNLAGFVGYDANNCLSEFSFVGCSVKNVSFSFHYSQRFPNDNYQSVLEQPKKYVSVFFNGSQWIDNIDAVAAEGNTYEGVRYFDAYNDNEEYGVNDFRSWSYEEANPDAAA